MDVDGLGTLLESVESEEEHKKIDQTLKIFFNGTLSNLINDENKTIDVEHHRVPKFKNKVYTVTAGGDDSFFVGKWNTILDFAILINKIFNGEFQKTYPKLSISAGLVIVDPKFPVVRFADLVENALKKAKYQFPGQKGNICIFNEVVKWEILSEIYILRELFKDKLLTGGLLTKARNTINNIEDFRKLRLDEFWKLGYYLRDMKKENREEILKKLEHYISQSIKHKTDELTSSNYRKIIPIAARLAELDHR